MKQYLVKVTGELVVNGETHADVKECLKIIGFNCPAARIKFLDIDRIQIYLVEDEEDATHES